MLHAAGVIVGLLLGLVATKLADVLPGRYDITHLVTGAKRTAFAMTLPPLTSCSPD